MFKIIMDSNYQLNNLFIAPLYFSKQSQNNTQYDFQSFVVYRFILLLLSFRFAYL